MIDVMTLSIINDGHGQWMHGSCIAC